MVLLACRSFACVFCSTWENMPKSFFTAPSSCQTSADRFSIARVRKPICKLLSIASSVLGPDDDHP